MLGSFSTSFGFGFFSGFPGVRKEHPASVVWLHPFFGSILSMWLSLRIFTQAFTNYAFLFQEHPACNSLTPVHTEGHSNKLKVLVRYRLSEKNCENTLALK